jgi:ceramide glucosyltransferase
MIYVFYFFSAVLVFLSYKSLRGGFEYLAYFKKELARPKSEYTPFVSVIAPCRGVDTRMKENLEKLFEQDFPDYEIVFVVDDEKDEAVRIIKEISRRRGAEGAETKLVIAGKAENEGQKVHNLREAVLNVSEKSEVFVFVDSDARPDKNWLRNLIAPLRDEKIGCATGYRWFISEKRNFASEMLSVWNASIASALGANMKSNFCWGGSMAIRRETFEKVKMRERWRGTLSDDFTVTRMMKENGLAIYFVPQALTASIENCSFKRLLEFTTRQMKITRVYSSNLWIASFIGSFLFNFVMIWAIFIIAFSPVESFAFWLAIAGFLIVSIFSIGKSHLRLKAVKLVLKNYENELSKQFRTQNTLWIFSPAIFFYNSVCALVSRKIVWRGIGYELESPFRTSKTGEKNIAKK